MEEMAEECLLEVLAALYFEEQQLEGELVQKVQIDEPLSSDSDRVERCFHRLPPLPNLVATQQKHGKNAKLADELRTTANMLMHMSKELALEKYSRSIALAPAGSKQLALGFLNRATALFCLARYDAAIRDLGRAASGGLPPESKYKLEELRARCLHAMGSKKAAKLAKKETYRLLEEAGRAVPDANANASRARLHNMFKTQNKAPVYDTSKPLPVPLGGSYPKVPCLSKHVDIRFSRERGRHLTANKEINPGDILIVEEPLSATLSENCYSTHCFHCIKRCLNMVPCPECSQAMFCSEKCRDDAWALYHNIECKIMPHIVHADKKSEQFMKESLRLTLKTLAKHGGLEAVYKEQKLLEEELRKGPEAKRIFDSSGRYDPASLRAVYYLPRLCLSNLNSTRVEIMAIQAARILFDFKKHTKFLPADTKAELAKFLGGFILRMITIHLNSAFVLEEKDDEKFPEIGGAVYAVSSLINHSCNSNTFRVTVNGGYIVHIATRPIAKGEEITVSYIESFSKEPRGERRLILNYHYQFTCMCQACTNNWPLLQDKPVLSSTLKCDACGGRFQGPLHYDSISCSHCLQQVETPILVHCKRICDEWKRKEDRDLTAVVGAMRALHKVMAFPNDILVRMENMFIEIFTLMGNRHIDSW